MKNKFLEKIARFRGVNEVWDILELRVPNHSWKPGLVGAGIGATAGAIPGETEEFKNGRFVKRKLTTGERVFNSALLGVANGGLGYTIGATNRADKIKGAANRFFNKRYSSNSNWRKQYRGRSYGGFNRSSSNLDDILKDMKAPPGGFKTKAEATRHYKTNAMKLHPDRGGSTEDMSKLNAAWKKYKEHPNGFEKLAAYTLLEKVAELLENIND